MQRRSRVWNQSYKAPLPMEPVLNGVSHLLQGAPPPGFNYSQYPPQAHPEMAAPQFQGQQYQPQVSRQ